MNRLAKFFFQTWNNYTKYLVSGTLEHFRPQQELQVLSLRKYRSGVIFLVRRFRPPGFQCTRYLVSFFSQYVPTFFSQTSAIFLQMFSPKCLHIPAGKTINRTIQYRRVVFTNCSLKYQFVPSVFCTTPSTVLQPVFQNTVCLYLQSIRYIYRLKCFRFPLFSHNLRFASHNLSIHALCHVLTFVFHDQRGRDRS